MSRDGKLMHTFLLSKMCEMAMPGVVEIGSQDVDGSVRPPAL